MIDAPLLARVRSEYREMPGLALTLAQARRLFQVSEEECRAVLAQLVAEEFLQERASGHYVRRPGTR